MANDTTLQIDIKGDAQGAVSAIERTKKKIEELQSRESSLKQAMDQVNNSTEEGRRLFAALKAQLDVTEKHMTKLNVASESGKNFGRKFNDEFGKMGGVLSALGSSTSETGQAIANMAGQSQGLVAAFAEGGPVLAGLTAAAFALSALNDKIDEYIEKAAEAETARITSEAAAVVSDFAPSRTSQGRTRELRESLDQNSTLTSLLREQDKLYADIAKQAEKLGSHMAAYVKDLSSSKADIENHEKILGNMTLHADALKAAIAAETERINEGKLARMNALQIQEAQLRVANATSQIEREIAQLGVEQARAQQEYIAIWKTIEQLKKSSSAEDKRALAHAYGVSKELQKQLDLLSKQTLEKRKQQSAAQEPVNDVNAYLRSFGVDTGGGLGNGEVIDLTGEGETMVIVADAIKDATDKELQKLEALVGFAQKTSVGVGQLPAKFAALGDQIVNAFMSVPSEFAGTITGDTSSMGAIGATLGGVVGGPIGSAVGGAAGSTVGEGLDQLIEKLQVFDPLINSIVNLVMQLEPLWQITASGMQSFASGLDVLAPIVQMVAEILALLQTPLRILYDGLGQLARGITTVLEHVMHYAAQFVNSIIYFANTILGWANNTFGTDFKLLEGLDSVAFLGETSQEAGEQIKKNFTNEMANLPPGFKVSSAMFAATSPIADPRGGGMGGMNIGVINVQTTRDLASELDSLRQRTISGASGIVQGRNSIQDRRN